MNDDNNNGEFPNPFPLDYIDCPTDVDLIAKSGTKTNWVMDEYRVNVNYLPNSKKVIYRLFLFMYYLKGELGAVQDLSKYKERRGVNFYEIPLSYLMISMNPLQMCMTALHEYDQLHFQVSNRLYYSTSESQIHNYV
ncbi:NAC domain containing protein [Trema orientale]|uniref:NAC domain containing protein n=1 Tax=Trema orientale TaxID=63057 RepID=A0A2P5DAM2_TREOI|nr:NAC domain containing protein [Trema orientale]